MATTISPLPSEAATAIKTAAFTALGTQASGSTHLAIAPGVLAAGTVLRAVDRQITLRHDAALVFVDGMPQANWGHPCRYQFFDAASHALVQDEPALFPPDINHPELGMEIFHAPLATSRVGSPTIFQRVSLATLLGGGHLTLGPSEDRFALLWTSQISNRRHLEDLEFAWRTLTDIYGFAADHILVLCFDGTINATDTGGSIGNWVGDNTPYRMQVHASATAANLTAAFATLAGKLKSSDLLFIHTNNHGSPSGMCVDGSTVVTTAQWGTMLATLPAFDSLVVTMEQCFSGTFQGATLNNSSAARTVFASAVSADKSSDGAAHFDPWALALISALAGSSPAGAALAADPDTNNDGMVSIKEACDYAQAHDTGADDNPQYADKPAGCGTGIHLGVPSTPSVISSIQKFLAQQVGPVHIPIPDPGPEHVLSNPATLQQAQALGAVAKAATRFHA